MNPSVFERYIYCNCQSEAKLIVWFYYNKALIGDITSIPLRSIVLVQFQLKNFDLDGLDGIVRIFD
jgi:hypothetical protein